MENTLVVDVDGTLCSIKKEDENYIDVKPMQNVIDKVNELFFEGNTKIILFTARGMRTYNGDVDKINKHVRPTLEKWLSLHSIRYHELVMGKPWGPNVQYLDDKALPINDFLLDLYERL